MNFKLIDNRKTCVVQHKNKNYFRNILSAKKRRRNTFSVSQFINNAERAHSIDSGNVKGLTFKCIKVRPSFLNYPYLNNQFSFPL